MKMEIGSPAVEAPHSQLRPAPHFTTCTKDSATKCSFYIFYELRLNEYRSVNLAHYVMFGLR